jgi:hypothetical protein
MACTIAVVREGLQRSLVRIFQVLRVATARSPRRRIRGVCLVHGLLPSRQLRPVAVPLERRTHGTAGALIRVVREGHHVSVGQRGDDAVGWGTSGTIGDRRSWHGLLRMSSSSVRGGKRLRHHSGRLHPRPLAAAEQLGQLGLLPAGRLRRAADAGLRPRRLPRKGRQSFYAFYALTRPELLDLLRAAEGLLAATGSAVALCPTYGADAAKPAVR